jgi:hypothetical protein
MSWKPSFEEIYEVDVNGLGANKLHDEEWGMVGCGVAEVEMKSEA